MPKPVPECKPQDGVGLDQLNRIQRTANNLFEKAEAVKDAEILNETEWQARNELILNQTKLDLARYELANYLIRYMDISGIDFSSWRTFTNVHRLVQSRRVQSEDLVELILAAEGNRSADFYSMAQSLFLGARLFFYEHVEGEGSVMCYMPQ